MIVFVHRENGVITCLSSAAITGYAEETLDSTTAEVAAFFLPLSVPPDMSNIDNLPKAIRAIGLMIANFTGKTPAQVKAAFLTAYNSLP